MKNGRVKNNLFMPFWIYSFQMGPYYKLQYASIKNSMLKGIQELMTRNSLFFGGFIKVVKKKFIIKIN